VAGQRTIFVVLTAVLLLVVNPVSGVNTGEINKVRRKAVLDGRDFQIIDRFVAEAVQELVETRDFTSIANARTVILTCSKSAVSGQAQYAERFSGSAYKYISAALEEASGTTPEERKFKVILNLLILVDGLENVRLANLAMKMLNDNSTVIRYWAVHSVTNAGITEQLNSGNEAGLKLASEITGRLKGLVEQAGPEITALIAEFGAKVKIPQGEDLLLQIADTRISRYADWTVKDELLDVAILKLLYSKRTSAVSRPAIARRFGQLYSYAMQRYFKGWDFLGTTEKHQLASVLAEIEKSCIGKLLAPQRTIREAVGRGDYMLLQKQHSRLFGDETNIGLLTLKLNCDYGRKPNGNKRITPLVLPEPPQPERAK